MSPDFAPSQAHRGRLTERALDAALLALVKRERRVSQTDLEAFARRDCLVTDAAILDARDALVEAGLIRRFTEAGTGGRFVIVITDEGDHELDAPFRSHTFTRREEASAA